MGKYQKIDTIFKRDANNIIMPYDSLVNSTLDWFRKFNVKFDGEEKIDGTNVRLEVTKQIHHDVVTDELLGVFFKVDYKGKTDEAQLPEPLKKYLEETYPEDRVLEALGLKKCILVEEFEKYGWGFYVDEKNRAGFIPDYDKIPEVYTLYGEGYGGRIQKAGPHYISKGVGFIGFDVRVGDWYLLRPDRDRIFNILGSPIVPFMGEFTIDEAIEFVRKGFKSVIAEDRDFNAEGLVLRTSIGLKNRSGQRIIFKVKTCDWEKYFAKYGTYDKVDQPENPNYKA